MNNNYEQNAKGSNNTKNIIFIILSVLGVGIIFVLLLLILIVPNKGKTIAKKDKTRTIMIYMSASDLESKNSIATGNLSGIDYNILDNQNVNVVLMAGGSNTWYNDYITSEETSIFELKSTGFKKVVANEKKNMGDSKTFVDFLNYTYDNYKTDEYDLIIWSHGGGLDGSEYDELSNDNLKLAEFKKALNESPFKDNQKLEMVIFRTCLNGMLEVANVFKDHADYMVSSEEVSFGHLSDGVLNFINYIKTSDTPVDIAKSYIDGYKRFMNYLNDNGSSAYVTYSITDLSKIDNLNKSINSFFSDINVSKNFIALSRVRANLYQYGYATQEIKIYDSVDLYNLVNELSEFSKDKANLVLKNLEEAVIYSWSTDSSSQGLAIYFPYIGDNSIKTLFLRAYEDFDELSDYKNFITEFYNTQLLASSEFNFHGNSFTMNKNEKDNSSDFELELSDEQLNNYVKSDYLIYRKVNNNYYKPIYKSSNVKLENNKLKANIKDRLIYIVDGEEEGDFSLYEIEENDKYIRYYSFAVLEYFNKDTLDYKTDSAIIYFTYDKKKDEVKITNVLLNNKNNTINSVVLNLKDYTTVSFAPYSSYRFLNDDGSFNENWQNDKKWVAAYSYNLNDIKFNIKKIDSNNEYYCMFRIWDSSGNYHYSNMIKLN